MQARIAVAAFLVWTGVLAPPRVSAQRESGLQAGARFDVMASSITAVQAGVEMSKLASTNVRVGLTLAGGESSGHGRTGFSARADLVGRFLLDPNFRMRWAPYTGGGLGLRYDTIGDWRGTIIAVIGVEGPNWGGVVPFAEGGFGGGVRLGVGFRATRRVGR
ncbi:MAG TPA: hypothetical protein VFU90_09325 [Candidatus Tumulicola sp.]|nr:hypothetical protein [Candidatus Tumulicola sp.]